MMIPILGLGLVFAVIQFILLSFAVGLGFLLHWLIPGVEIGTGILAGAIVACSAAFIFVQGIKQLPGAGYVVSDRSDVDDDEYEEEEEEETPPPPKQRSSRSPKIGKHWKGKHYWC